MSNIDNMQDMLDVRDIIARVEELEEDRFTNHYEHCGEAWETSGDSMHNDECPKCGAEIEPASSEENFGTDEALEFEILTDLLEELRGYGGDEQWRGDWYPLTLIRDNYFKTAIDELLEDIGDLPKDLPGYLRIEVDYEALQMDYSSVELDGVTYWYR